QILTERRYTGTEVNLDMETIRNFFNFNNIEELDDWILVLEFTLNERRKEFMIQGMRWFDIKRFGIDVSRVGLDGTGVELLAEDDPRKALQIPRSAQEVGGLQPNRR
ncbi:MAG: RagB/SusD family nutrient uptake outer membrane protein, partial [Bacteroidota bacterium]